MADLYAAHDVLLEPARANAGGVTLTDATASGLPVVATRTGGVPSIVDDGVTGFLVDADDPVREAVAALRMAGRTGRVARDVRGRRAARYGGALVGALGRDHGRGLRPGVALSALGAPSVVSIKAWVSGRNASDVSSTRRTKRACCTPSRRTSCRRTSG